MSIRRLYNHTVTVYRATPVRPPGGGGTVDEWDALDAPDGPNARPDQGWSGALQDHGPGEQQSAARRWFLHAGFDVAERDVIYVEEGPEADIYLRVGSVTPQARMGSVVHHIEVNVEVWPDGGEVIDA